MNSRNPAIIEGLLTGIAREVARVTETKSGDAAVRHAAWYIAVGGFGLTYEQIGQAQNVTKQAVGDAIKKVSDRCDDRAYERNLLTVAFTFGVQL